MELYKITHPATNQVVNLYIGSQTGSVPNGTRLSLYSWQNNNDQKWQLEYMDGSTLLRLARDTNKVMNRNSSNNNAHVWAYDGTTATKNDSLVATETSGGNTRIKLVRHGLYLTKNANDSFLSWAGKIQSSRQYFEMVKVSGGGSGGSDHTISMPVNLNQRYDGNSAGVKNTGCALCCGIDMASFKQNRNYTISDFTGYYSEGTDDKGQVYSTYSWTGPNGFRLGSTEDLTSMNEAQTISVIRDYVNRGIPVVCHAIGSGEHQHWFVAYKTTSGGNTWATSGLTVLDPYNSDHTSYEGRRVPIWDAMRTSYVTFGIDKILLF